MTRAQRLTKELKHLDRDLFCRKDEQGRLHVLRKGFRHDVLWFDDETPVRVLVSDPRHVVSLTHNWSMHGSPVDWGIEPLVRKMREIDGWNPDAPVNHVDKEHERAHLAKRRDFRNKTEDFLYEFRPQFAKTFADVNTSNMAKIDKRRKKEK